MTLEISSPALRYHGGKFRLASWIISHFPAHQCYVEPFGGAASVLLKKPRSYAEVYNDLDGEIVNFFRVVRDPEQCVQLIEALTLTPYARAEFELAFEDAADSVERARRIAVRAQMGFCSCGATKSSTGFRSDTKRQYGTTMHNWNKYPSNLAAICQRLLGVLIENKPWQQVVAAHDAADTLFFIDPPYLHATRKIGHNKGYYRHEMTDIDHLDLLKSANAVQGMAIVSGYPSEMYRDMLADWHMVTKSARASAFRGSKLSTEVLWFNPACVAAMKIKPSQVTQ